MKLPRRELKTEPKGKSIFQGRETHENREAVIADVGRKTRQQQPKKQAVELSYKEIANDL